MRDILELGSAPHGEDCASVGAADYRERSIAECNALRNQLRRVFGPEPDGATLSITSNNHDFGVYREVACRFDSEDEEARAYAYRCEDKFPETWDNEARVELGLTPVPDANAGTAAEPFSLRSWAAARGWSPNSDGVWSPNPDGNDLPGVW